MSKKTVASPPTALIAFQWHTKVRYVTKVPLSYVVWVLVIDKKAFAKLSSEDQTLVHEVMGLTLNRLNRLARDDNREAMQALVKSELQTVVSTREQVERWRDFAMNGINRLVDRGVYSVEVLRRMQDHLEFYNTRLHAANN